PEDEDEVLLAQLHQFADAEQPRVGDPVQQADDPPCLALGLPVARAEAAQCDLLAARPVAGQPQLAGGPGTEQALDVVPLDAEVTLHAAQPPRSPGPFARRDGRSPGVDSPRDTARAPLSSARLGRGAP